MEKITTTHYPILFNGEGFNFINQIVESKQYEKYVVLVDENTHEHCLPEFLSLIPTLIDYELIEVQSGESAKSIEVCSHIWQTMLDADLNRNTLLLNLGGGVVTDLGGFIASTFKRGIDFINIPTSLLSMVDASIGGKTGINFNGLKNQVGTFSNPKAVLVYPAFLSSLPARELKSGYAEMLKHGLIQSEVHWNALKEYKKLDFNELSLLIRDSILIKKNVVEQDPTEKGLRKILNFGHTIGHALETYFSKTNTPLTHGECVAIGLICESYLSTKYTNLSNETFSEIKGLLQHFFDFQKLEIDINDVYEYLKSDKKNTDKGIQFVLLNSIETPILSTINDKKSILESLSFFD